MLINRKKVKEFALAMTAHRNHQFTRVGKRFYIVAEAHLKEFIRVYVQRLPSKGKTIQ